MSCSSAGTKGTLAVPDLRPRVIPRPVRALRDRCGQPHSIGKRERNFSVVILKRTRNRRVPGMLTKGSAGLERYQPGSPGSYRSVERQAPLERRTERVMPGA